MKRRTSLARELLAVQILTVLLTVSVGAAVSVVTAQRRSEASQRDRVLAIATTLAQSPDVVAALSTPAPSRVLEPVAESVRLRADVAFVVVMSPTLTRYSHPNRALIGGTFQGHVAPALAGRAFTETYTGSLGPSVRAVVPVTDGGRVVALVAVGVLKSTIGAQFERQLPGLLAVALGALLLGIGCSALVTRRVKRQTLGLEPPEIAGMYEHHDAVLHAMREGLLVVDRDHRVVLANDEAKRLLALPERTDGTPVGALGLDETLAGLIVSGSPARDEVRVSGERVLIVNQTSVQAPGRSADTVTTLRDRTELESLLRELDVVRDLVSVLRAQAHESANRLHTIVTMVELGRYSEAVQFATREVEFAQDLVDRLLDQVGEPAVVALLLGKAAAAAERGVELRISEDTALDGRFPYPNELVTILGNLVDNALEAVAASDGRGDDRGDGREDGRVDGWVEVTMTEAADGLFVQVRDNGPGIGPESADLVFQPGWTTKTGSGGRARGVGLALVRQTVTRLRGSIEVGGGPGTVFTVRLPVDAAAEVGP